MAGDIIEHLENFDGFIECCKTHMHDESVLLVTTPNPWYWRNALKASYLPEVRTNPEHTCWLCPQTLRQLVSRHGMKMDPAGFGTRLPFDRALPLPRGWKNSTFHAVIRKAAH